MNYLLFYATSEAKWFGAFSGGHIWSDHAVLKVGLVSQTTLTSVLHHLFLLINTLIMDRS